MRKEEFGVGDYVHVYNRGNRKMDIVRDEHDRWRFLACLRYYNDQTSYGRSLRDTVFHRSERWNSFQWPDIWPAQKPLTSIATYSLMPNHYHLLLREIIPGGITSFLQKLGIGFTSHINIKYSESGRIFQGAYKARRVTDDRYLQYVDTYIQVLNPFELLPVSDPLDNFEASFGKAIEYPFCSLGECVGKRNLHIVDRNEIEQKFNFASGVKDYNKLAQDALLAGGLKKFLGGLCLD